MVKGEGNKTDKRRNGERSQEKEEARGVNGRERGSKWVRQRKKSRRVRGGGNKTNK